MDNQHKHIAGYRDLTESEVALMNEVKAKAAEVGELVDKLRKAIQPDDSLLEPVQVGELTFASVSDESVEVDRWLTIGQDHLQQGFMALTRAIARPTTF